MKRTGVLFVLLMAGLIVYAQVSKPIQFKEETFDFGSVVEEDGPVTHEFVFTNVSSKPLQILTVKPSCGCTTPGWTKEPIMPGKTGSVKAQFDPKGRPGYFSKSLTVTTDFDHQPLILHIKGTVTSKGGGVKSEFQAASGSLRFKSLSLNFGKVYRKDEFVVKTYDFINAGSKPVSYLEKFDGPEYMRVQVEPAKIGPGEKGTLKVSYNGKLKNQYGFQSDNIVLHTDDELQPKKTFNIYATLEDYFPELKPEALAKAPKAGFSTPVLDFGAMKQNRADTREVQVTNMGKSVLEVRSIVPNCTCIQAVVENNNLKPGESTSLKITFNPLDRKGTQTKSVMVYTNDPQNPVQRITLGGVVE